MKKGNPLRLVLWPFLTTRAKLLANMIAPHVKQGEVGLDVGSGNMLVSKYVAQRQQAKIRGVDVLDMNLTSLSNTLFDGKTLPFRDKSFDFSLLIGVLHHVEKQQHLLDEAMRVTRKRIIIFEDVYFNPLEKQWIKIRDILGNIPEEPHMHFALNFHSEIEWERIFRQKGLTLVHKRTIFNPLRCTHHALYVLDKK